MKKINLLIFALCLTGIVGCGKEEGESQEIGIPPSSIEDVTDVFELKYGEIKECVYDNQSFKFSVIDIEDNTLPCAVYDFTDPEEFDKVRIHTFLRIATNQETVQLKVSSAACTGKTYKNDGTDIQSLWDLFEEWQSSPAQQTGHHYFKQETVRNFGDGALIKNTSFSIYLGGWYPYQWNFNYAVENSMYKFIFIITNKKSNTK